MTDKILSKLNPVHLPTVSAWMEIAHLSKKQNDRENHVTDTDIAIQLQSRFEELTRGKWVTEKVDEVQENCSIPRIDIYGKVFQPALLRKEMFVCEVERPKPFYTLDEEDEVAYGNALLRHQLAQSQIWFEGFEKEGELAYRNGRLLIIFPSNDKEVRFRFAYDNVIDVAHCAVFDFLYFIDRYNRTASSPIKINWTENFIKQLLK